MCCLLEKTENKRKRVRGCPKKGIKQSLALFDSFTFLLARLHLINFPFVITCMAFNLIYPFQLNCQTDLINIWNDFNCCNLRLLFWFQKNNKLVFLKKNWPIPASFCLFSLFSLYNFNNTNWKKLRWCACDSNPGPQDGRRRRNHRAMAVTKALPNYKAYFSAS